MQNTDAKKPKRTLPAWAGWLIGYACVLAGAAGLVHFWRVAFSLSLLPALPFTLGVAALCSLLYLTVFLLHRFCKDRLCLAAFICILVLGLLYCFATAPLQVPDEERYFLRSYSISMGRFNYDGQRGYPNDVDLLFQHFVPALNHKVTTGGHEMAPSSFALYQQDLADGVAADTRQTEPIAFMLFPYFPQALGIAVGRLFGFSALGLLYAGRLGNLLAYALICYAALHNCNKYRGVFMALALLPLSLFMATSNSQDSLMLALCYLVISYFCKDEIRSRDVVVFGIAMAVITYIKPHNVVLAFVLLLIPKSRWKTKWNPRLAFGIVAAAALLFWYAVGTGIDGSLLTQNYGNLPRGVGNQADPAGQMAFILGNPLSFLARAALTLYEEAGFLFKLGVFGWLDMSILLVSGLSVLSMASASALGIQQKEDTKFTGALALFLAAGLYACAVLGGIYVLDSPLYSIRVTGVQPRYFLPAFLLLFMLASILLGKAVRPRLSPGANLYRTEAITLCIVAAVALVSVVFIFQNTFIGQWIPKGEGGYKLVNMFGWQQT